jgi:hypothetical protein
MAIHCRDVLGSSHVSPAACLCTNFVSLTFLISTFFIWKSDIFLFRSRNHDQVLFSL